MDVTYQDSISRRAFTIIELLVAVLIVVVLLAVTIPAVIQVREAARSTACQNNQRQIATAVLTYSDTYRVLPGRNYVFRHLLPVLGESPERVTTPSVLMCSSEDRSEPSQGKVSYLFNEGYAKQVYGINGVMPDFWGDSTLKLKEIRDGLSNTALLSEKLLEEERFTGKTLEEARRDPLRSFWLRYSFPQPKEIVSFLELMEYCRVTRELATPIVRFGLSDELRKDFGYNHNLTPNLPPWHFPPAAKKLFDPFVSVIPPSSNHGGRVNVAFADGSVHSVPNTIDSIVWAALGTRNGSEIISFDP